jgi:hypothetical protein
LKEKKKKIQNTPEISLAGESEAKKSFSLGK